MRKVKESKVYLVIIVRECGVDVWGVYETHRLAEDEVFRLVAEKNKENSELDFDFAHVVERSFFSL
jgi:hypothetical protein